MSGLYTASIRILVGFGPTKRPCDMPTLYFGSLTCKTDAAECCLSLFLTLAQEEGFIQAHKTLGKYTVPGANADVDVFRPSLVFCN